MDMKQAAWQHRADLEAVEFSRYPLAGILDTPRPRRPISLLWGFLAVALVLAILILA